MIIYGKGNGSKNRIFRYKPFLKLFFACCYCFCLCNGKSS